MTFHRWGASHGGAAVAVVRRWLLVCLVLFRVGEAVGAETVVAREFDSSASNLMVVLRESQGENKQDEALVRSGKGKVALADGKEVDIDFAWFEYLGDMHVRFVFDTPTALPHATPQDLDRLGLTPEAALERAVQNIRRVYGEPSAVPWNNVMEVRGKAPDLFSSYFLDKTYWNELLKRYPEGIVAVVVKRGGLLYAPVSNERGVDFLRRNVGTLYSTSERLRISSAVYLYKDGRWTVLQSPLTARVP